MSEFDGAHIQTYYDVLKRHRHVHRAFGIDTDVMRPRPGAAKAWDTVFVGTLAHYKRPLELLKRQVVVRASPERHLRDGCWLYCAILL